MSDVFRAAGTGPLAISLGGVTLPADPLLLNASSTFGDQLPFNLDPNSGDVVGLSKFPGTCVCGDAMWLNTTVIRLDAVYRELQRLLAQRSWLCSNVTASN